MLQPNKYILKLELMGDKQINELSNTILGSEEEKQRPVKLSKITTKDFYILPETMKEQKGELDLSEDSILIPLASTNKDSALTESNEIAIRLLTAYEDIIEHKASIFAVLAQKPEKSKEDIAIILDRIINTLKMEILEVN